MLKSLHRQISVNRIYLNELGKIRTLPIWVALMILTTIDESQAPAEARYLLERNSTEQPSSQAIYDNPLLKKYRTLALV